MPIIALPPVAYWRLTGFRSSSCRWRSKISQVVAVHELTGSGYLFALGYCHSMKVTGTAARLAAAKVQKNLHLHPYIVVHKLVLHLQFKLAAFWAFH